MPRRWLDRLARGLAALTLRVFYRRVEVVGAEQIPAEGPLLLVANHGNSLIDPIVMLGALPRPPRFLAKSTLWGQPVVRPLLALAGALPVHRHQDAAEGADPSRNLETFARCHDELAAGGTVALFPEGVSHHEASLRPLRTGAARIALEGAGRGRCPLPAIVPVGLTFEDKGRFRSQALVVVGAPLDAGEELRAWACDERGAVRALTARIEAALGDVTLNADSWDALRLAARAADLLANEESALPGQAALADRFTLRRALTTAHQRLAARHPREARAAARMLARYEALLERHSLRDDQLAASYPWADVGLYALDRLPALLLGLPAAVLGAGVHWPAYRAAGWISDRFARHPDLPATFKVLAALLLLPLTWVACAAAGGLAAGPGAAALALGVAPASGWVALRFSEHYSELVRETRVFVALRLRRGRAAALRARRRAIRAELTRLAALAGGVSPAPAGSGGAPTGAGRTPPPADTIALR